MDRRALIYKGFPPDHCCCDSALRQMPDESWACFFMTGGIREPEPANHVRVCRSTDEGETWGPAEVVYREAERASLLSEVYEHEGVLTLMLQTHRGDFSDWRNWTIRSADGGRTWSQPEPFAPAPRRAFIRNRFVASWGEWYLPLQSYDIADDPVPAPHADGTFRTPYDAVLISGDQGRTWEVSARVEPCVAWAENNLTELRDGRLVMLIRADGKGCLYRSESRDHGRTWSEAVPTDIPNPGSKFRLHRLSDRRIVLIHNPNAATSHPNSKMAAQCNRNPLAMWISDDDMATWGYQRVLVEFPGMLAYPDGFVSEDERYVHFSFDYNRHDVIYWGAEIG